MGYIYKITNDINNKIYVGKTENSIQHRFKEHCIDAFRDRNEKRPLYSAMRKYGIEHFSIELIEETDNPEEREIYWIAFYEGYVKGYNATRGGDGKCLYDHKAILNRLKEYPYPKKVSEEFGCCVDIVKDLAKTHNITVQHGGNQNFKSKSKSVSAYTKDNVFVKNFNSTAEAAIWCVETGKCTALNSGVRSHIASAANGKRKSAYTYIWKYE